MKKILNKATIFFIIGILLVIGLLLLINTVSAADAFAAAYMILALIPIALIMIIDRILVWKFGAKKTNKCQMIIIIVIAILFLIHVMILNF